MVNSQSDLYSLFSAFFGFVVNGSTMGEQEFNDASSEAGVNMPLFKNSFFSKIASAFGLQDRYGIGDQAREAEAISREAVRKIGHENGIVPQSELHQYFEAERELKKQVYELTQCLRDRRNEVAENTVNVSYTSLFQSDEGTQGIISEASKHGVPPTLIDNVKQSLVNGEDRVNQNCSAMLDAMMKENGFVR